MRQIRLVLGGLVLRDILRPTITKKVGLLLLLPTCGAFIALSSFYFFLDRVKDDRSFIVTAGNQGMLSEQLYAYAHMVHIGQEEDRGPLTALVTGFDRSLDTLEQVGQDMDREFAFALPKVSGDVAAVRRLWGEMKPRLLLVAERSNDDPQAQAAYGYVESHVQQLAEASERIVAVYDARMRTLRAPMLTILIGIANLDLFLLFGGVWLARRFIARPILHLTEATQRFRRGEFTYRISVATRDELATLAEAFNAMVVDLARLLGVIEAEREYNGKIVDSTPIGLVVLADDLRVLSANRSFHDTFVVPGEEVRNRLLDEVLPVGGLNELAVSVLTTGHPQRNISLELERSSKEKSRLIRAAVTPIRHAEQGEEDEARLLLVVSDVTEIAQLQAAAVAAEEHIKHQLSHDALTGLPNRLLLKNYLTLALARAHRTKRVLAVLFLDLDRFKLINETLGYTMGDRLLQVISERLTDCLRENDIVARQGGDEFTVLLEEIAGVQDAATAAQRILHSMDKPFVLEGHQLYLTASMGISLYPHDGEDMETLVQNAEMAMYRAKEQGRNNYQFYTPELQTQSLARLALENGLRQALEQNDFCVYYQPQIELDSARVVGVEALVRWRHPERGLVLPGEFIPLAEDIGLIVPLGEWVLRTACAQNKAWQDAGYSPICMAVNLSARQFLQHNLAETVERVLRETGLDPRYLDLEITETTSMENVEHTVETLHALKALGVQISIDDFGTGYSSLSYLKRFPLDKLKIDRSFVRDIVTDPDDASIALAVIALAHSLNLKVVAEGVETEEQLPFLREHQCDQVQGYLCSPPVQAENIEKLLLRGCDTCRLVLGRSSVRLNVCVERSSRDTQISRG